MVTLQSGPERIAEYQTLLLSEWKKTFPEEVLSLLWGLVAGVPPRPQPDPLFQLLDPGASASFPIGFFRSLVRQIAEAAKFIRLANLPEMPAEYVPPRRLTKHLGQANRLAAYLTLQAHTSLIGDVALFADVQALAFQAAVHFVLPELREKHPAEHAILLHATVLYAVGYSSYDSAHYLYMMSMIHDYLGNDDQRLQSLYAAFRLTPPTDHSYLTKAQEVWTELLDKNRPEEAQRFLVSLPGWSLPEQQEEVRAMVVDGFRYLFSATGSGR
jgi:hypothetical protein